MTFPTGGPVGGFDENLPINGEAVAQRWWWLVEEAPPWNRMERDDAFGMMRGVIRELLNEARDVAQDDRRVHMVAAARSHGEFRRGQRCGLLVVDHEFDMLIDAIAEELRADGWGESLICDALVALVDEVAVARAATVSGWMERRQPLDKHSGGSCEWLADGRP